MTWLIVLAVFAFCVNVYGWLHVSAEAYDRGRNDGDAAGYDRGFVDGHAYGVDVARRAEADADARRALGRVLAERVREESRWN